MFMLMSTITGSRAFDAIRSARPSRAILSRRRWPTFLHHTAKLSDDLGKTTPLLDTLVRLRGPVANGYGRGGKKLGFPTANLPSSLFQDALSDIQTGVYVGWAMIEGNPGEQPGHGVAHKAAVNVGYSPTFEGQENQEKIVEAHLIPNNEPLTDFYGEVMRLSLLGFLRPEQKFDSFPDLVAAITNDVETTKVLLDEQPFITFSSESQFMDPKADWIGSDGGDSKASWEFQRYDEA